MDSKTTEGLPIREFESVMGAQLGVQEEAAITAQSVEIMDTQVKRIRNFFGFFKNSQKDQNYTISYIMLYRSHGKWPNGSLFSENATNGQF